MSKLQSITQFLIGLNLVAAENIASWIEEPQIILSGKSKGNGGALLYSYAYKAIITIERYPHKKHSPHLLFAHVAAWLMENDADRSDHKDADILTEVEILDDSTADVVFTIDFYEDIEIVPDPAGTIQLAGETWRLADAVIDYAEEGDLHT